MINFPYLKQTIKSNYKFFIIMTLVLCVFLVVVCSVFTPQTMGALGGTNMGDMFSMNSLIGFMSSSFYAMMAIIFPMIYSIIVGNNLIAKKVDDGSMAGYLSTPVSRKKIVISSALYLIISLILMWIIASIVGISVSNIFQPGELEIDKFLILNLGAFLYHFAISSICFVSSCIFNNSKNSLLYGAGIPLCFFVISLLCKLSDSLDWMKYLTLNTLFDTNAIITGGSYAIEFIILGVIGIVLYVIGINTFKKKNLPL